VIQVFCSLVLIFADERVRLCGSMVWWFWLDELNGWCSRNVFQASLGVETDRKLVVVCSVVVLSR
jgi:hypothetical protein